MVYLDEFSARLIVKLADEAVWALEEARELLGVEYTLFDLKGYSDTVKRGVLRNIRSYWGCDAVEYRDEEIMVFVCHEKAQ